MPTYNVTVTYLKPTTINEVVVADSESHALAVVREVITDGTIYSTKVRLVDDYCIEPPSSEVPSIADGVQEDLAPIPGQESPS